MNTTRRHFSTILALGPLAAAAALGACILGCGHVPFTVVTQANPNVLAGQTTFAVRPVEFDKKLIIDGREEEVWLAMRSDKQRASWENDKSAVGARFFQTMLEWTESHGHGVRVVPYKNPNDAPFVVSPRVSEIKTGNWTGFSRASANFDVTISVANGKVVDRITFVMPGSGYALGDRMTFFGAFAGRDFGMYLLERVGQ